MAKQKIISVKLEKVENLVAPKAKLVKKSLCSCGFFLTAAKTICLILFYYCFSISLTFYNQRFIHVSMITYKLQIFNVYQVNVHFFCISIEAHIVLFTL